MAIKITKDGDVTNISLSNGHSEALKNIMSKWRINSEKEALGFALSIVEPGNEIYTNKDGKLFLVAPSGDITTTADHIVNE